jgi:multiple sugar transport system substrate-binding protein
LGTLTNHWMNANRQRGSLTMPLNALTRTLRPLVAAGAVLSLVASGFASPIPSHARTAHATINLTEEDYWSFTSISNAINALIKGYEQTHPNVTITRTVVPGTLLLSKYLAQSATNSLPSILMPDNPMVQQLAQANVLAPIDSEVKAWGQWNQYFPGSQQATSYNGHIYGIHMGTNDLGLIYNTDMFKAAGISHPPATWAELLADAPKLTHGSTYAITFVGGQGECAVWQFEPWLWTAGGDLQKLNTPGALAALNLWTTLVKNKWASKSVVTWCQNNTEQEFVLGNAAIQEDGPWNFADLKAHPNIHWALAPIPVPKAGMKPIVPLGGEVWAVGRTDPAQEAAAWDFIKWSQQPSVLAKYDTDLGYIPVRKDLAANLVKQNPLFKVFVSELATARPRTTILGANYPAASTILFNAIQSALTFSSTPSAALSHAQSQVDKLLKK